MYSHILIYHFNIAKLNFYRWRINCGYVQKLNFAIIMACFTGLGAQIRIYTPISPVPITGQVFFVLLSAVLLGKWWGGISQSIYVGIGLLGVPWFAPNPSMSIFSKGGVSIIYGSTIGYLIGFIIAAFIIGWFLDNSLKTKKKGIKIFGVILLGILIIHLIGLICLFINISANLSTMQAINAVITALILFIPLDLMKAVGVGAISYVILPRNVTHTQN